MTGLTLFLVHTFNRWILPWKCGITEEELRIPLAPVSQKNSSHVGNFFVFYWESRALRSSYSISLLFQGAIYSREVAERLISHWASMLHISQKRNTVFDTLWKINCHKLFPAQCTHRWVHCEQGKNVCKTTAFRCLLKQSSFFKVHFFLIFFVQNS